MDIDTSIFKAYDIRGVYDTQINESVAYAIGQAYAQCILGLTESESSTSDSSTKKTVVVGKDVRLSGPALFTALTQGLLDFGVNVVDIGVITTDMMYFTVAKFGYDGGIQISASHNPGEFNGFKMVRKNAAPVSGETGIYEIRDLVYSNTEKFITSQLGTITQRDVLQDYIEQVLSVIDIKNIKPFSIVANLNFGAIGKNLQEVAKVLPLSITWLNEQPNGAFPKGRPDPLVPENRGETMELIKTTGVDFGVAWDADADRCYFFDETGRFLSGYFTSAILAEYFLDKHPHSKVVIDMKQNWAIKDVVAKAGGTALPNRTGHSLFKERMIKEDAVFGGEVSGHFYFKDFFYLDNGLIPFLIILDILSKTGKKLSDIYQPLFDHYFAIEETNFKVRNVQGVLEAIKTNYGDGQLSELDGISVDFPTWRFNVRSSNTEALVRLNLEAKSKELMQEKETEVAVLIQSIQ